MLDSVPRRFLVVLTLIAASLLATSCVIGRGPVKPAVTITTPQNGAQVPAGQEVNVESLALDDTGVVRVELWIDGELLRVDAAEQSAGDASFEAIQPWIPSNPGRHNITVKAFNTGGTASDPATVLVEVLPAQSVVIAVSTPTATATVLPTSAPTIAPTVATCMNNAAFVTDVTIPDETKFHAGETFEKTWRMRNSGSCPWETSYTWVFESGEQMGHNVIVGVPPTIPGADADIHVALAAPAEPGHYVGRWRMHDPNGQPFGQKGTVVIIVLPADLDVPAAPTDLSAEQDESGSVLLTWRHNGDNEQGVNIYSENGETLLTTIDAAGVTEATIENLPCDTQVSFLVRAYNEAGESPPSQIVSLRTAPCQPNLPLVHYFTAEPDTIDQGQTALLSWDLEGAREARIFPGGEGGVVAPDTMVVSPDETTTYRLVATNEFGTVEEKVTVTVKALTAAAPTITIVTNPDIVGERESFQIIVTGHEDNGVDAIWWWGDEIADPILGSIHAFECQGQSECSETWDVEASVSGTLGFLANGRSVSGVQVEQEGALPTASIRVVPILFSGTDLTLDLGQCMDLETGVAAGCDDTSADIMWVDDGDGGQILQGLNGAVLAYLGTHPLLDAVRYLDALNAHSFVESLPAGESGAGQITPNAALAVRTDEGRLCKVLIRSIIESLTLDAVTYLE